MKYLTAKVNDRMIKNALWLLAPNGYETNMGFLYQQSVEVIGYYPVNSNPNNPVCIVLYRHEGGTYVYKLSSIYLDVSNEQIKRTFDGIPSKPVPELHIPLTSSVGFLEACKTVQEERGKEYQKEGGERSFKQAADAFNAITGKDLSGSEVALLLQVLKDVRQWQNPNRVHEDSLLDCVAYAALKAEEVVREVNLKEPF